MAGVLETAGSRLALRAVAKALKTLTTVAPREALVNSIKDNLNPRYRLTGREVRRLHQFISQESTWPWLVEASIRISPDFIDAIENVVLLDRKAGEERTALATDVAELARSEVPGALDSRSSFKILSDQIRQIGDLQRDLGDLRTLVVELLDQEHRLAAALGAAAPLGGTYGQFNWISQNNLAAYFAIPLLDSCFLEVNPPSGTRSFFLCQDLRAQIGSLSPYSTLPLWFRIEVLSADGGQPTLEIDNARWRGWLDRVETEPVLALVIQPFNSTFKVWLLNIHDWMINRASRPRLDGWPDSITVRPADLGDPLDYEGERLHGELMREADRAMRAESSKWRTLRDYGLLPMNEGTFHEFMELARFLELPARQFEQFQRASRGQLAGSLRRYLTSNGADQDALTHEWVDLVGGLPLPTLGTGMERREFRRFVRLIRQGGRGVRLPPYRSAEVGTWRSFVSMYPESIRGLAHIIRTRSAGDNGAGDNVAFAAAMLPMLALSTDRTTSKLANLELVIVSSRVQDWSPYHIRRELLRAPAEAGSAESYPDLLTLLANEGTSANREARFLSRYGWGAEVAERNIIRMLTRPTLRDENLRRFYEIMGEIVVR